MDNLCVSEQTEASPEDIIRAKTSRLLDRLVAAHPERARKLSASIIWAAAQIEPGDVPDDDDFTEPPPPPPPKYRRRTDIPAWTNLAREICKIVCNRYDMTIAELTGESHTQKHVRPRIIAIYLIRKLTKRSTTDIGREIGRDHSTVVHSLRRIAERMQTDLVLAGEVEELHRKVTGIFPWAAQG